MNKEEQFIFGLINFGLLIAVILWGFRRLAKQFFFARHTLIKKDMVASAHELRNAKTRAIKSRKMMENLKDDISARHQVSSTRCEEENKAIIEDAKRNAAHFIEEAKRQCNEEHRLALVKIREKIISNALQRATEIIKNRFKDKPAQKATDLGIEQFSALLSKDHRYGEPKQ